MFKSTKEFESSMKKILTCVRDEKPLDEFLSNIDYCDAILECEKRGFLQGIQYFINGNGLPVIEYCSPRITYCGLEFIENY